MYQVCAVLRGWRFAAAFIIGCMIVTGTCAPAFAADGFRVLSYNIRTGFGARNPELRPYQDRKLAVDLTPVIAAIRSVNADIVALQEVRGEDQAREIADALGMHHVYARHGETYGHWWGLAVLSPHRIDDMQSLPVSHGRGNTRSDLLVRIGIGGQTVTVVNTHADKDIKDGSNHETTIANLADVKGPLVLLGDFNARPSSPRLKAVRARLADAVDIAETGGEPLRHHGTHGDDGAVVDGKRIDYVFVDARYVRVRSVGLIDPAHRDASDHLGVFADLQLRPE